MLLTSAPRDLFHSGRVGLEIEILRQISCAVRGLSSRDPRPSGSRGIRGQNQILGKPAVRGHVGVNVLEAE